MFLSLFRFLAGLLGLLALAACSSAQHEEEARQPVVLAASSLQGVLEQAADAWAAKGHSRPQLAFAASSALSRQIEHGAPADIFISADLDWMDYLADKRLILQGSRTVIAGNRLVLIARGEADGRGGGRENVAAVLAELGDGRLAMAEPESVPAGRYGRAALESLGLWQDVRARIAPAENVRAVLALVESGEAPLGIVYATDALASPRVRVRADLPASSHDPVLYPGALLLAADRPQAGAFLAFLASAEGQAIFAEHGFAPGGG